MKRSPLRPSRKRLPARSKRRTDERVLRDEVRREVIARDRGCVAEGMPDVPHGRIGDRGWLECNELAGGSRRSVTYLQPAWCVALCPLAHDWVTAHPLRAERYGLRLPSHAGDDLLIEAALFRSLWTHGVAPMWMPSWWGPNEVETCRAIEESLGI
jgi:hypothetical protein